MEVMEIHAEENGNKILLKMWFLGLESSKDEEFGK